MVGFHTADGWLAPELHQTGVFAAIRILGGLAAPLFFFGLGIGAGLRPRSRCAPMVWRGLFLVAAGYALSAATLWIDWWGFALDGGAWPSVAALIGAGALVWGAVRRRPIPIVAGAVLYAAACFGMSLADARAASLLSRVDVLHALGAALLVLSLVPRSSARSDLVLCLIVVALACAIPGETVDGAPHWLSDYFVADAAGQAKFPLLPWLGYAFAGRAAAAVPGSPPHRRAWLAAASAGVAALGCAATPWCIEVLTRWPEATPLARFAFRAGAGGLLLAILSSGAEHRVLAPIGRRSLSIYCVHLTFAFGAASRPLRGMTEFFSWACGAAALVVLVASATWMLRHVFFCPLERGRALV